MDETVKTRVKSAVRRMPGFKAARFVRDLTRNTETRNAALLLLRPPKGLYQPWGTTSPDRYPGVFSFVRSVVNDGPQTRILSFGCATGEEVFSLRSYFPEAQIDGFDINPWNIALCRMRRLRRGDGRMRFAVAASAAAAPDGAYDAIFAMAVFRHGALNVQPPPERCDTFIRFEDFERSAAELARAVRPGGLLAIENAMFRFADTGAAAQFTPAYRTKLTESVPLYDRDNRLIECGESEETIFRKQSI